MVRMCSRERSQGYHRCPHHRHPFPPPLPYTLRSFLLRSGLHPQGSESGNNKTALPQVEFPVPDVRFLILRPRPYCAYFDNMLICSRNSRGTIPTSSIAHMTDSRGTSGCHLTARLRTNTTTRKNKIVPDLPQSFSSERAHFNRQPSRISISKTHFIIPIMPKTTNHPILDSFLPPPCPLIR